MMDPKEIPKEMTDLKYLVMDCSEENIEIIVNLHAFFNDIQKVFHWLKTPNPMFGEIAPLKLMQMGRGPKVLQFILQAEWERDFGNDDGS